MKRRIWSCKARFCYAQNSAIQKPTLSAPFTSTAATASLTKSDGWDSTWLDASCILQDKDLLKKGGPDSKTGIYVLDLIESCALEPDRALFTNLIKKCTNLKRLKEGRLVHAHLMSCFREDLVMNNNILNMYAKCGSMEEAQKVFEEMPVTDTVSWTALITGYTQSGLLEDAVVLFPEMLRADVKPNEFTLSSLLKASGTRHNNGFGRQLHGYCLKHGYILNVYVGSALVDMYARWENIKDAESIFNGLVSKNEVSWNALIAGHARKGEGELALSLFSRMLRKDFKPTPFTYSSIFGSLSSTGFLEQGKWVHAHMIKSGSQLVGFVGNTLLDMYAKSGSIEDAEKVFSRMLKLDLVSWNSLLKGYAQHGRGSDTLELFKRMLSIGVNPSDVTFLAILTACSHVGCVQEGEYYFQLMKTYAVEPQVSHYVTMVDLFGRAGLLDQAERFIQNMPIEPNMAVWGALLGACRMHKNLELGAYAAQRIFELDSNDSGPHMLLSNIYASAGRWDDVANVRSMMRVNQVKKEPAISWVEIKNCVHSFVANDDIHPQREEIQKMWEKVSTKIKEVGYVPDSSQVLFYSNQQEKEERLQVHSEKIAFAFALLNTPPGSTIRIKKNIRICPDCHSAFKFASKIMGRDIILRDTNRFHHFQDGSCSCGDYW
ncbi:hypothetical protein SAY87_006009 [Trapa incisa]|uniref:DYW domain-containing protein n=1 Tax=Trapa incisa TaxID=236973 RepID=A0AAN7Q7I3_9MYRT|nr:hypothetical protein SAY87_006009 [Trapa incisa]